MRCGGIAFRVTRCDRANPGIGHCRPVVPSTNAPLISLRAGTLLTTLTVKATRGSPFLIARKGFRRRLCYRRRTVPVRRANSIGTIPGVTPP